MIKNEDTLPLDPDRLAKRIEKLGRIGLHPDGGLDRGVYDHSWAVALDVVEGWLRQGGLETRRDAVGNLFGRLEGRSSNRTVMSGSHIDTVVSGGAYDGALGIHAAVEAIITLADHFGPHKKALEVLVTCEEEGSRFPADYWAARALVGTIEPGEWDHLFALDGSGRTIADAMRQHGLNPERVPTAKRDDVDAFVELHIEQGRVLEEAECPIGIVEAINGKLHVTVEIVGRADHAGNTPMSLRQDALAAAADLTLRIEQLAVTLGSPSVATVGEIRAEPGVINVIAGRARLTIDARAPEPVQVDALEAGIRAAVTEVAAERGIETRITDFSRHEPVALSPWLIDVLVDISRGDPRYDPLRMQSGAGHDSQIIAPHIPTGMVFVPSVGGISHSPSEFTRLYDIVIGVDVLGRALHQLAESDGGRT